LAAWKKFIFFFYLLNIESLLKLNFYFNVNFEI
jgi:hypothetical protein